MSRRNKDKDKQDKKRRDPKQAALETEARKVEHLLRFRLKELGDEPIKKRSQKLMAENKEHRELQIGVGDEPDPELTLEQALEEAGKQLENEVRKAIIAERKKPDQKTGGREQVRRHINVSSIDSNEEVSMTKLNTADAYFQQFGNDINHQVFDYITEESVAAKDARVVKIRVPLVEQPGRWEHRQVILTEDNAYLVALNEVETYNLEKGAVKPIPLQVVLSECAKHRDSIEEIGKWAWRAKPGQKESVWQTRRGMLGVVERLVAFKKTGDEKKDVEYLRQVFKDLLCIGGTAFEADSHKVENFLTSLEEFESDIRNEIAECGRPEGADDWIGLVRRVSDRWVDQDRKLPYIPINIAWTPYFKDMNMGACVAYPKYLGDMFYQVMEYAGLKANSVPLVKWFLVNRELEAEAVRAQEKRDSYIQENGRDLLAKLQAKIGASPSKQMAEAYQAPTLMDNYRDRGGRRHNERDEPRRGNRGGGRRWDSARHEAADDAE